MAPAIAVRPRCFRLRMLAHLGLCAIAPRAAAGPGGLLPLLLLLMLLLLAGGEAAA